MTSQRRNGVSGANSATQQSSTALQDVPVLLRLPDLGGAIASDPLFSPPSVYTAADDSELDQVEATTTENEPADPVWKKEEPGTGFNKLVMYGFIAAVVVMLIAIYNQSGTQSTPEPADQWVNAPEIDPGVETTSPVDVSLPGPGTQVAGNPPSEELVLNPTADPAIPPLPDITPERAPLSGAVANQPSLPRQEDQAAQNSLYPSTDPARFRYPEQLPFMQNDVNVNSRYQTTTPGIASDPNRGAPNFNY